MRALPLIGACPNKRAIKMSDTVRCPNRACTQVFPANLLVDGTRYQCPACASQFVFNAPVSPQSPSAAHPQSQVAPPSQSNPQVQVGGQKSPSRRNDAWWIPALFAVVGILLAGFLALVGIRMMGSTTTGKVDSFTAANFAIKRPEGFFRDAGQELEFQADLVYTGPEKKLIWAVVTRDYGERVPSYRELLELALEKLRKKFPDKVEYEKRGDADETLMDIPFTAHEFVGRTSDNDDVAGEFFVGTSKGIGYVLYGWARTDDRDQAKPAWKLARSAFSLLDTRAKWKPEEAKLELAEGKGWEIRFDKKFWTQEEISKDLKETHPKAVLRLEGKIPGRKVYAGDMAEAYVMVLEGKKDLNESVALAKDYLAGLDKPVDESKVSLEPTPTLDGEELDKNIDSQGTPQKRQLLRLLSGGEAQKIYLIQVGLGNKQTVVLAASCPMGARKLWEENLMKLADGLTVESP